MNGARSCSRWPCVYQPLALPVLLAWPRDSLAALTSSVCRPNGEHVPRTTRPVGPKLQAKQESHNQLLRNSPLLRATSCHSISMTVPAETWMERSNRGIRVVVQHAWRGVEMLYISPP